MLESNLELGERLKPLVADVTGILEQLSVDGRNVLFEGAQGAMLDVDLGTYPYVTSSTTTAGGAAAGTGLGPRRLHEVLGIVKAYATRVGAGPFPTELFDEFGEHLSRVGHEFGSVTGRRRRCGWFDAVALRRSIVHSSCSLLCVTKLDVLDGLDTIRVCVGYRIDGGDPFDAAAAVGAFRRLRGGLRGNAGLEGEHASASRDYEDLPRQCPQLPGAAAGPGGRAHHHHLDRSGSGPDHHSPESFRLITPQGGGAVMAFDTAGAGRSEGLPGAEGGAAITYATNLQVFVYVLFFAFGGITSLNDVIIPKLKALFTLSYGEVMLVQSAFFAAYFIISIPAAALVRRIGYMRSAVVGLLDHDGGLSAVHPRVLVRLVRAVLGRPVRAGLRHHHRAGGRESLDLDAGAGAHRQQPADLRAGVQLAGHHHLPLRRFDSDLGSLARVDPTTLSGAALDAFRGVGDAGGGAHLHGPRHRAGGGGGGGVARAQEPGGGAGGADADLARLQFAHAPALRLRHAVHFSVRGR